MTLTISIEPKNKQPSVQIYANNGVNYVLQNGIDMISNSLKKNQEWEPYTQAVARMLVDGIAQPVVVDIGANLGAFAVPMSKYIQAAGGQLWAFEPQRMVYYQLCANLFINGLTNCFAIQAAIGANEGTIDVPLLDVWTHRNLGGVSLDKDTQQLQGHFLNDHPHEKVTLHTLNQLKLPTAHLIKIDVEGLELAVLQGARKWLKQSKYPPILFEVWGSKNFNHITTPLLDFIRNDLGYKVELNGEMGLAQHPSNTRLAVKRNNTGVEYSKI
jgi:FkbM family methyltransferase